MRPKNKMTLDEFKDKHYGVKGTESRNALENGYENFIGNPFLEAEENKIKALRLALLEGENSQIVKDFDPAVHLESLHRKH
ncbi:MAG: type II toxin-antitoxin system ParD family antitoxin [Bacteroidales bacterium]